MQSGVAVSNNEITGTLKYVTGYTGFSGEPEMQEGNYLALKFTPVDEDDVITVELLGGTVGHPVTLDEDLNMVLKIGDPKKQKIRVVTTHDGVSATDIYYLHQLNLEAE